MASLLTIALNFSPLHDFVNAILSDGEGMTAEEVSHLSVLVLVVAVELAAALDDLTEVE